MSLDIALYHIPVYECRVTIVYEGNLTHNLTDMAEAAGLYHPLWRPRAECSMHVRAKHITEALGKGLANLLEDPNKYIAMNPSNGWGSYGGLVEVAAGYLAACEEYPDAFIDCDV